MNNNNLPEYLCGRCKSSSNRVRLDSNPVPRIPILLRKVDRTHVKDSEVCPFCNSWGFERKRLDVDRRNIRWGLDRNWRELRSILIIGWPESFSMLSCTFQSGFRPHWERSCSPHPSPSYFIRTPNITRSWLTIYILSNIMK